MQLRLIQALECATCGALMSSDVAMGNVALAILLGMKSGWRMCRCGMSAIGMVGGVLTIRTDFDYTSGWPDAGPVVTRCPFGAAANALVWP